MVCLLSTCSRQGDVLSNLNIDDVAQIMGGNVGAAMAFVATVKVGGPPTLFQSISPSGWRDVGLDRRCSSIVMPLGGSDCRPLLNAETLPLPAIHLPQVAMAISMVSLCSCGRGPVQLWACDCVLLVVGGLCAAVGL